MGKKINSTISAALVHFISIKVPDIFEDLQGPHFLKSRSGILRKKRKKVENPNRPQFPTLFESTDKLRNYI